MRPSGVVSHVLLLRQQPCTITTGTSRSALGGVWYWTYIWLTVTSPAGPGPFSALVSPPTKKLPWLAMTNGRFRSAFGERPWAAAAVAPSATNSASSRVGRGAGIRPLLAG